MSCMTPGSPGCTGPPPKHIIAVSIFQLATGYRDPGIYADGLLRLGHAVKKYLPDFTLRIYTDGSVMSHSTHTASPKWIATLRELAAMSHVQIVYVACEAFYNKDTHGHRDLFGTVLRLMPMFTCDPAAPSWLASPPEGGTAVSFDTDIPDEEMPLLLNMFKLFSESTYDVFSLSQPCTVTPWNTGPQSGIHLIMAGLFAMRCRLPRVWFDNYIKLSIDTLADPTIDNVLTRFIKRINEKGTTKPTGTGSPFVYGYDEIFINHVLVPQIIAWERKTTVLEIVMNTMFKPLIRVFQNFREESEYDVANEHVQNIFKIACQTLGLHVEFPITHEAAKKLSGRIMHEMGKVLGGGWIAMDYCKPGFTSDARFEEYAGRLFTILGEVVAAQKTGAYPASTYFEKMYACMNAIGPKPFSPVLLMVGWGKSEQGETTGLGDRAILCGTTTMGG